MTKTRNYEDPCGVARALDRVGERWALLIVRELLLGPKRFTDLRAGLPTASPNVLSQRLEELLAAGVLQRRQLEPPARVWVYELTSWGRELEAVLLALGRWGGQATPLPRAELSADALLLALRTTFEPRDAAEHELELRLDASRYCVRMSAGGIEITRASGSAPEAVLETDARTLRRVVFGDLAQSDAERRGLLRVAGNARSAARFLQSFRRPKAVSAER